MATSSITHNFFIGNRDSAERFIRAIESAEIDKFDRKPAPRIGRELKDPEEIAAFAAKYLYSGRRSLGKTTLFPNPAESMVKIYSD